MAIRLDSNHIASSDELLMSQEFQEAIILLLIEKGTFTTEEFLEMVEVVNREIRKMV